MRALLLSSCMILTGIVVQAQGGSGDECEQAKQRNWRQKLIDCSRQEISLFNEAHGLTYEEVAHGLSEHYGWKEGSLTVFGETKALELERQDFLGLPGSCTAEGAAYKHEFKFVYSDQDGPQYGGAATVYRASDHSLTCVTGGSGEIPVVVGIKTRQ